MDVITSHINADFDALASAMAAKKLYPDAVIVLPGSMERRVRDFIDAFQPFEIRKVKDILLNKVERLIIVDTKHPDRIGSFKELLGKPEVKVHIYDHHPVTKGDIRGEVEVFDVAGAQSTIFTEIIQNKGIPITPLEATILCLGIYEETGSLIFTSTTPRDLMAAAYLVKKGANLNIVSDFLKEEMSREEISLLNELVQSLREVVIQGVRVRIGKGKMEGVGDVSHLAHQIMEMEDTDAVVLLIAMADKIVMIARSKAPELDVSQVLADFGGGGHHTAASATIKDMPFEIVEENLLASLKKHTRPVKLVKDIMTTPVITVQWSSTIREAERVMTRYGINAVPVVKNSKYRGVITRGVVEKALFHGLGRNRCEDFATTDAITAHADAPVAEVERAMIEQNQHFVTVLENSHIVGAITRTDILRSLYEDFLRKSRVTTKEAIPGELPSSFGRNVAGLMRERLPDHLYEFLVRAGEVADESSQGVYLVGGCVRDLLRGETNLDIDLVVEGDGIAFAKALGKEIGAKVIVHKRFGTAQLIQNNFRLDVATARTEYYESPAALPKVELSSIKRDLYRRDFTINTLAVKLNKKDFGILIDFFGGQRDLKERVIRVLHNLSFVEDPTRAFRAIRFSERFGFRITKHTDNLIKLAIRMNIFEKLAGTRLYDEMALIFNETDPVRTIKRLGDYGLLKVIHPSINVNHHLEALLKSVHDTLSWFDLLFLNEQYDKGMIYVMALLYRLSDDERRVALDRLSVLKEQRKRIMEGLRATEEIVRKLWPDHPAEVFRLLVNRDIEVILFSMALAKDNAKKKAISNYLLHSRNIKPILKGDDLKELGIPQGPVYSEIFRKIHEEKLMGRLKTKEEEIEFVKKHYKKMVKSGK
ncbi:MAG: CBS domain-containing protein [Nitrospirota bacterium]